MINPIKRVYQAPAELRRVKLHLCVEDTQAREPDCEVIEYDSTTGWETWENSVFVQDFEDSVLTAPAPLQAQMLPTNQAVMDHQDAFSAVGRKSA